MRPINATHKADLASRFLNVRLALSTELPDALDRTAALAIQAQADGDLPLAAASAGVAVLTEHLQAAHYRHAPRMLSVLAAAGPESASDGSNGLLAWAGAAVAHDYGVLPSWPRPDIATLMERAQHAPTDVVLALACALGEVCERSGDDAEFAALNAQVAAFEVQPGASAFWRGHWAVVSAWHLHLHSFAKPDEALRRLETAQALAAQHDLKTLGATAALQRARLIESQRNPAKAVALAEQAVAHGDPARTPLWWADQADVHCRVALQASDFHAALGHSRRAVGHLQAAGVWPGYQLAYRVNEAYALLGAGAVDEALRCLNALNETPQPRHLSARLKCLTELTALAAADQRGHWDATLQAALIGVLRSLRELEWPSVLPFLPVHIARLFVRALTSGVEHDWVRAAIRTRKLAAPRGAPEAWPWSVKIRTLGSFEVISESGPLAGASYESRKAASKPLQLLRCLAAHGHDGVLVDVVAESLWPGDGRAGRQKAFDVTVARLRRLLDSDAAVSVGDRRVRLNEQCVWVDAQALNERLSEGEAATQGSSAATAALDAALALYRGPCLGDSGEGWAVAARERLRARLAAALLRAARWPGISASQVHEWSLRAASADPQIERLVSARGHA